MSQFGGQPMQPVERVEHSAQDLPPAVELSDATLAELVATLDLPGDDQIGKRQDSRLRVRGQVMITPLKADGAQSPRQVSVYDISRSGIAIVDDRPMEREEQFTVLLPRIASQNPVEMICTARHTRPLNGQFVIGARYGGTGSNGSKSNG